MAWSRPVSLPPSTVRALLVTSIVLLAAGPAGAQSPTLAGETLYSPFSAPQWEVQCNPDGNSTLKVTTSGTAAGPYPGTFEATMTIVIGPHPALSLDQRGVVTSWEESFTIYSGTTTVTGTKRLSTNSSISPNYGVCFAGPTYEHPALIPSGYLPTVQGRLYWARAPMTYSATIQTVSGTYTEHGDAWSDVSQPSGQYTHATDPALSYYAAGNNFDEAFLGGSSAPTPATLQLSPEAATNPVSTTHTVTATVTGSTGAPFPGATVLFTVSGSVSKTGQCTTGSAGTCTFSYVGPALPGADAIAACVDSNASGACDTGEPAALATKAWLATATTPGQCTGGGQVPSTTGTAAFGFTVKSDQTGVKGECSVVEDLGAASIKVKCTDVTSVTRAGNTCSFFGNGTIDGVPVTYRVDTQDNAEPGTGKDVFRIQTSSGYGAGGVLLKGNVQVR